MSVTEMKRDSESRDESVVGVPLRARVDEPRVIDFYRSITSPFFGAVVSRRDDEVPASGRRGSQDRPTLVTLVGELDLATAPLLDECLTDIVGDIHLDCSGLDFVGAPGMDCLLAAHARTQQAGARLVIVEPPPSLLRLLRLAGADPYLEINVACVDESPRDGRTRAR